MPKFSEKTHQRVEFTDDEIKDLLKRRAQELGLGRRNIDDMEVHYTVLEHEHSKRLLATVVYNGEPTAVPHGAGAAASSDPDLPPLQSLPGESVGAQEHGDVMRSVRPSYSNSSEEFGSQEHSCVMDAILGRGNY